MDSASGVKTCQSTTDDASKGSKMICFNTEQHLCGPLNAACTHISSQFACLWQNKFSEIEVFII